MDRTANAVFHGLSRPLAVVLLAALLLTGCSGAATKSDGGTDDAGDGGGSTLRILPFAAGQLTLMVNQTQEVWVNLSEPVTESTYVDVSNLAAGYVDVTPLSIRYDKGDDQEKVDLKGVQVTNDQFLSIRFGVRGTSTTRKLEVKVKLY